MASSSPAIGRRGDDRQRLVDEPERLLGRVRGERGGRGVDRELRRALRVAGGERVLGEHRQSGRRRVPALEQQLDHGAVDLAPARLREQAIGEVPDLDVGEGVVGRVALGVLEQQAGLDRRLQGLREILAVRPRRSRARGRRAGRAG